MAAGPTRRELLRTGLAAGASLAGLEWAAGLQHALADAFALCDRFFCSVIGPTDPNQLMLISGTLDPDGRAGGPMLETTTQRNPRFSWTTMPEQLRERGVSWKVYTTADNLSPEG